MEVRVFSWAHLENCSKSMLQHFSPLQNHILSKLKNAKFLRYSDMQPDKVPNDLYNYHLQFLVKKGFVTKSTDGYALSASGIKHVADPYPVNEALTSLFKINVITGRVSGARGENRDFESTAYFQSIVWQSGCNGRGSAQR